MTGVLPVSISSMSLRGASVVAISARFAAPSSFTALSLSSKLIPSSFPALGIWTSPSSTLTRVAAVALRMASICASFSLSCSMNSWFFFEILPLLIFLRPCALWGEPLRAARTTRHPRSCDVDIRAD